MRLEGRTLLDIAETLGVAKSSVSVWVRDLNIEVRQRRPGVRRSNALHTAKLQQIAECDRLGVERVGTLSEDAFLAAGAALYAGEGSKRDGAVSFANTDPAMMRLFAAWLRHFFVVDEARLRMRVYLHEGRDLGAAERFWSDVTGVPLDQFRAPYRARADAPVRNSKHEFGCAYLSYGCSRTHP